MKIVYTCDIHGNTALYEELLFLAELERAEVVILGGDLLPKDYYFTLGESYHQKEYLSVNILKEAIADQRHYLAHELFPRLSQWRAKTQSEVLLMLGNDDFRANEPFFEAQSENLGLLTTHNKVRMIGDITFVGCSLVDFTPFLLKDWETYDRQKGDLREGSVDHTHPDAILTCQRQNDLKPVSEVLEHLTSFSEPSRTIFILHAPPYNSGLDILGNGYPAGSRAVSEFIKKYQPPITFHGHIHEAPEVSSKWAVQLGSTLAIQPGQSLNNLHAVVMDTSDPLRTGRHTVYGRLSRRKWRFWNRQ